MQEYIAELSKYFITILFAVYALECFLVFRFQEEKIRKGIYLRQRLYIFLIQFLAFYTMAVKSGEMDYLFFYAFVQVFLFAAIALTGMIYEKINRLLLNNMCMLLGISFIVLSRLLGAKLSVSGNPDGFLKVSVSKPVMQLFIVIVSLLVCLAVPTLMNRMRFLKKLTWVYAAVGIVMLAAVLILGNLTHGSKISFSVGGITFQPSEFVKLIFVFFLAAALAERADFLRIVLTTVIAAAHVIILVLSRDLGSALIFFAAYVFIVFMATGSYLYLSVGIAAFGVSAVSAYYLFDHVRVRVLAWKDPFSYIDKQGYQITQSLFAIGSGNWFGLGLFGGTPGDIPYVETDFIFSAICEELGVISAICILLICLSSFIMMLQIGMQCRDGFYRLIALGFGVVYIFQIFLTVGGGIKFIPMTGVTFPFISYGGSSILTTMLLFFVIQALYLNRPKEGGSRHVPKARTEIERQGKA